jgi:hypothetical protein
MDVPFLSDGTNQGYAGLDDGQRAFMAYLMYTYDAGDNVDRLQRALLEYFTDQQLALPRDRTVWGLIRHFYEQKNSPVWQGYIDYQKQLCTKATTDDSQIRLQTTVKGARKPQTRRTQSTTTTTTTPTIVDIPPSPRILTRSDSSWKAQPVEYTKADWRRDQEEEEEEEEETPPDQGRDITGPVERAATQALAFRTGSRVQSMPSDLRPKCRYA